MIIPLVINQGLIFEIHNIVDFLIFAVKLDYYAYK